MEFWEHHGEATVNWFGTSLTCRPTAPAAATGAAPPAAREFVGTTWTLVEFKSMDDTTLRPQAGTRYSLSFTGDGSVHIQADCNRGRGTWRSASSAALEFGPVALTRAMCPASPLQDRFVRDLGYVRSYTVHDGHLYLSLMADGGIYDFEVGEAPR